MRTKTPWLAVALLALTLTACGRQPASSGKSQSIGPTPGAVAATEATTASAALTPAPGGGAGGSPAPGRTQSSSAGDLVATVNGTPIALDQFQRQAFDTQRYFVQRGVDPNTADGQTRLLALRRGVLDDMINQHLVEQAAAEMGLAVSDAEVQQSLQGYIDQMGGEGAFTQSLSQTGTTRDEVLAMERSSLIGQKVFDKVVGDVPTTAEFVHARHILCETNAACEAALARLNAGESFDKVATAVSIDKASAARGGDLDWVGRGTLPSQQVEDAIFALQAGQRSGVVQTDYGYHIIEVLARDPSHALTEEQRNNIKESRLSEWLAKRRAQSDIVIYVAELVVATATPTP
jgi:foldase protein PrsA